MLPEKQIANKTHQQRSKFVTVIHPEKLTSIPDEKENIDRTTLVSWLFLIGSLIFLFDGFVELTEDISLHAIFHNLASLLFTIGSIFFWLDARTK
ncbi:MAG: hypothetical protein AAGA16_18745 [Cyanobacteria bacterium P01_E01_bin.35]